MQYLIQDSVHLFVTTDDLHKLTHSSVAYYKNGCRLLAQLFTLTSDPHKANVFKISHLI